MMFHWNSTKRCTLVVQHDTNPIEHRISSWIWHWILIESSTRRLMWYCQKYQWVLKQIQKKSNNNAYVTIQSDYYYEMEVQVMVLQGSLRSSKVCGKIKIHCSIWIQYLYFGFSIVLSFCFCFAVFDLQVMHYLMYTTFGFSKP